MNKFGVFDSHYDKMIEISICDAKKYFIIELSDPKIWKELLKRFRKNMDKNGGFHVPIEDDQPGFKLTHIDT